MCSIRNKSIRLVSSVCLLILVGGALYGMLGKEFLPGNEVLALYILAASAYVGGMMMSAVRLPPLLGMLLVGMLFRNWSLIPYHKNISVKWSSIIRDCALTIILLKAGLGLDPEKLATLKMAVFKLSLVPCLCEAISSSFFSHYILQLPWTWSLMLGFILSAVSAAVLVPGMLDLDSKQIGTNKGIPTLILASVSIDNIVALTGFFVTFSIATSEEVYIGTLIKRPLEPFLGLLIGGVIGFLAWHVPNKSEPSRYLVCLRLSFLCLVGLCFTFLSKRIQMAGAGALGCISFAFVASLEWRKDIDQFKNLTYITGILWTILETFLFGLIGAQVTLQSLQKNIGIGILILFLGILVRFIFTILALFGSNLTLKEKTFISASWISKATVQAAVGSQAVEFMKTANKELLYGEQILSMSVLSIVLTAPLGAVFIDYLGPYLLKSEEGSEDEKRHLVQITVTDYSGEVQPTAPAITDSYGLT